MAKYTVQSPIKSGGKIHEIGVTIALDDETAAPLLALGRIKSAAAKNSSGDGGTSSSDDSGDAARQAAKSEEPAPGASTSASAKKSGGKTSVPRDGK